MEAINSKTVLIVDDEPAISQLLTILLASHGYSTKVAVTGRQALECITPNIDLVLLDMVLPDTEGIKICQQLKSNSLTRDIPIIIISGKESKSDRIESLYFFFFTSPIGYMSESVLEAARVGLSSELAAKAKG